jgi:hypothetical protein
MLVPLLVANVNSLPANSQLAVQLQVLAVQCVKVRNLKALKQQRQQNVNVSAQ